ncbi:Suppressor of Sensor Kinase (SLN1), partial [Tilletia horrida]
MADDHAHDATVQPPPPPAAAAAAAGAAAGGAAAGGGDGDGARLPIVPPRPPLPTHITTAASEEGGGGEAAAGGAGGAGGAGAAPPLPTAASSAPPTIDVFEPRQRLEWQTMLSSVLASEVLRSETKRITSVDAPVLTPTQLMYHRWLEIHARLRGRAGGPRNVVDAEEKRLRSKWEPMLKDLTRAVKEWTPTEDTIRFLQQTEVQPMEAFSADQQQQQQQQQAAPSTNGSAPPPTAPHPTRTFQSQLAKNQVLEQVGVLLARVDLAESEFPSTRKAIEVYPEWGSPEVQNKLAALYSWYNVSNMLRLQISILQRWTGSEKIEIERPHHDPADLLPAVIGSGIPTEGTTFVERIFKEDSLTNTFEKRTLSALNRVIEKAKRNILRHHHTFEKLHLPSFEPELVQIISFPTRLMEAALRLRLDYAGKLNEPGMLIVDSLTDDLRAAIAVACRIKTQYTQTMVPDPPNGWEPPSCISRTYDEVLRDALGFFFKLLIFKLKGGVFFKETEILEPEWKFLSMAADVIEGGDLIVAQSITHIVNM